MHPTQGEGRPRADLGGRWGDGSQGLTEVLTMMMYQLLTTVSSNKVTAKRKGEREKGRDQTHFVKVRFKGPFFTPLEYRAPKRWHPHSSGRGLQKRQARPSPSTRPTEDAAVLARPRALCPSSLRWSRAGGGGGSGERAPAP